MTAKEALVLAYEKGYRVTDEGIAIGLKGNKLKTMVSNKGYRFFHIKAKGEKKAIFVHRLMAYQKYGEEMFEHEMVRHLDNNKDNNARDNISVGSWHDNYGDMSDEIVNRMAADSRKFSSGEVMKIRESLAGDSSIRQVAKEYKVSPGTIQQIKEGRTYKWVK